MENSPKKRNRSSENFTKATLRLLKRGHQISCRYNADVYILVCRKHRHYDYNSTKDPSFPASQDDIEKSFPLPVRRTPADFMEEGGNSSDDLKMGESRQASIEIV